MAQPMSIWFSSSSLLSSDSKLGVFVHGVLWELLVIKPTSWIILGEHHWPGKNGQGTCWVFSSTGDSGIRLEPVPWSCLWVLDAPSQSESTLSFEEEEGHKVNNESMTMPLSSGREEKRNPLNCNLLHLLDCFLVVGKVMDSSTPGCPNKWIRI